MSKHHRRAKLSDQQHIALINARNKRIALLSLGLCVVLTLLACMIAGLYLLLQEPVDDGRILSNVTVGGVNIGDMTQEEARSALLLAIGDDFSTKNMVVHLPSASLTLSPETTKARLDLDAVLEAAYAYGRNGSTVKKNVARLSARGNTYTIALLPYLELDLQAVADAVNAFCDNYSIYITQPSAYVYGERPEYSPGAEFEDLTHQTLVLTTGTPQFILDSSDVYDTVLDAYSLFQLNVSYEVPNQVPPEDLDLQAVFEKYCMPAQDAVLNTDTFAVTPEVVGYGFDIESIQPLIDSMGYGQQLLIPMKFLLPDITAEALTSTLFQDTLSSFTSVCPDANDKNRNTNLKLSCQAINGFVLKPGESFDFNKVLGPRTTDRGYKDAPSYSGSTTNAIGGGISQTASALHYCVMLANLQVDERHTHRYTVNYTPVPGTDAAITYGSQNFVFTNNTSAPIRILASADGDDVSITLLGTKTDNYVYSVEYYTTDRIHPAIVYQSMAKDNVGGYLDGHILQTGLTGCTVRVYLRKRDTVTGQDLGSTPLYYVTYEKRDQIVVRIENMDDY